jgi:hypothetical protein
MSHTQQTGHNNFSRDALSDNHYSLVDHPSHGNFADSHTIFSGSRGFDLASQLRGSSSDQHGQDPASQQHLLPTGNSTDPKLASSRHNEHTIRQVKADGTTLISLWWRELLACITMLGMLLAMVGVLRPHENRPLPDWKYGISINALISIFSTVLKAASVAILAEGLSQMKWGWFYHARPLKQLIWYDEASRSLWGCLQLAFHLNWRDLIATAGAITAILGTGVDFFTQNLVHYYNCAQKVAGGLASVPRTQIYGDVGIHTAAGQ